MAKPITIEDIKVILTQPRRSRLAIVKIITSEPGLYGSRLRHFHPAYLRGRDRP